MAWLSAFLLRIQEEVSTKNRLISFRDALYYSNWVVSLFQSAFLDYIDEHYFCAKCISVGDNRLALERKVQIVNSMFDQSGAWEILSNFKLPCSHFSHPSSQVRCIDIQKVAPGDTLRPYFLRQAASLSSRYCGMMQSSNEKEESPSFRSLLLANYLILLQSPIQ